VLLLVGASLAAALGCASGPRLPDALAGGGVAGQLRVAHRKDGARALLPAVVYLARRDIPPSAPSDGVASVELGRGSDGASIAVLPLGQSVRFRDASGVHHRLFGLSGRTRLEAAVAPGGTSAPIRPLEPGLLRMYCALHPEEAVSVFVAPSPHFAVLDGRGRFAIRRVPPGRWRMHLWSDAAAGPVRDVRVRPFGSVRETIWLDAGRLHRP
jgi:hypothetical protein